jgi:hypothetical protein
MHSISSIRADSIRSKYGSNHFGGTIIIVAWAKRCPRPSLPKICGTIGRNSPRRTNFVISVREGTGPRHSSGHLDPWVVHPGCGILPGFTAKNFVSGVLPFMACGGEILVPGAPHLRFNPDNLVSSFAPPHYCPA